MEQSPENPETRGLRVTPLAMEGAGETAIYEGTPMKQRL